MDLGMLSVAVPADSYCDKKVWTCVWHRVWNCEKVPVKLLGSWTGLKLFHRESLNGGLRYLSTIIVVILWRKFPLKRGQKRSQKCTIVDDCAQIAESGLKPPFESPHWDFPDFRGVSGHFSNFSFYFSFAFFWINNFSGRFRSAEVPAAQMRYTLWKLWTRNKCYVCTISEKASYP